jgi:hypothetical protein
MIIHDFPNYHIFRNGSILSEYKKKFLTPGKSWNKMYKNIILWHNGKRKNFLVHRLVAMHFIPNPNNYPNVDHIDGNKLNNHVSNLRWCNQKMNMSYDNVKIQSNNKSGIKNIFYEKGRNKWRVDKRGVKGKRFNTKEEAITYLNSYTKTGCLV